MRFQTVLVKHNFVDLDLKKKINLKHLDNTDEFYFSDFKLLYGHMSATSPCG